MRSENLTKSLAFGKIVFVEDGSKTSSPSLRKSSAVTNKPPRNIVHSDKPAMPDSLRKTNPLESGRPTSSSEQAPLVSVLVPAFNVESYLPECLDSILAQTEKRFEAVVMDDGSTDKTARILEQYARQDPRIRFIHQENAGPAKARNRLLDEARGKWIFLCDADDKMAPEALGRAVSFAEAESLDAVFFGADVFFDSPDIESRFPEFKNRYSYSLDLSKPRTGQEFFRECMAAKEWKSLVWLMLFKRELVQRHSIRFFVGNLHEDDFFVLQIALHAQTAARLHDRLYHRRIREGSLATTSHSLSDYLSYVENALATIAMGRSSAFDERTRSSLGALASKTFRLAKNAHQKLQDQDKVLLINKHPLENVFSEFLTKTRTEEEFRDKVSQIECLNASLFRRNEEKAYNSQLF